jgi:hypothetical protein
VKVRNQRGQVVEVKGIHVRRDIIGSQLLNAML